MVLASLLCISLSCNAFAQVVGALDSTFNNTGFVTNVITPTASFGSNGTSVAIQSDGKIIVTGVSTNENLLLVRYNSDGTIDNSFGLNGIVETDFGSIEEANDIVLQPDGKIVVGGREGPITDPDMLVVRYNINGTLDSSFGTNGRTVLNYFNRREVVRAITVAPDGSILGIGETSPATGTDSVVIMAIKLRPNGLFDSTFSGDGIALLPYAAGDTYGTNLVAQPDGKIVITGYSINAADSFLMQMVVARFNTNGTLDALFGTGGIAKIHFGALDDQSLGYTLALQGDGKIIIAGDDRFAAQSMGPYLALTRLNTNGTPDISFGTGGKTLTPWGNDKLVHCGSIALQSDGKIIASGYTYDSLNNLNYIMLARYNSNGAIDNSFNGNGKVNSLLSQSDRSRKAAIQNDGKVVIGGHSYDGTKYYTTIARYITGAPTAIPQHASPLKDLSVYPNRIERSSVLRYWLTSAGCVDIYLVDMNGKMVRCLAHRDEGIGTHSISLAELSTLPAGVYSIRVTSGTEAGVVKVVIE